MTTHKPVLPSLNPSPPIRHPTGVTAHLQRVGVQLAAGSVVALFLDHHNLPIHHVRYDWRALSPEGPHPREIFWEAMNIGARFVILVHRHLTLETGAFEPDVEQLHYASHCALTGQLLGVPVLDYLIVNETVSVSLLIDHRQDLTTIARRLARPQMPISPVCLN